MKKNSKGFTLIELLAVIVILAIIALIATPVILNIIKKARLSATQDSAYSLRKAAQLYYSTNLMLNGEFEGAEFKCDSSKKDDEGRTCFLQVNGTDGTVTDGDALELDGTNPKAGTITISATGLITYDGIEYSGFTCPDMKDTGTIKCQ